MATTDPIRLRPVEGYTLTADKVQIIESWMNSALRDYDVATDPEDSANYQGYLSACSDIMGLLRND